MSLENASEGFSRNFEAIEIKSKNEKRKRGYKGS
jgi:hypothetical protein